MVPGCLDGGSGVMGDLGCGEDVRGSGRKQERWRVQAQWWLEMGDRAALRQVGAGG